MAPPSGAWPRAPPPQEGPRAQLTCSDVSAVHDGVKLRRTWPQRLFILANSLVVLCCFVAAAGLTYVDRKAGQRTYMRMGELQAGVGLGVKKFQVVFIFETADKLDAFVNQGWEFGAQTTAAATTGEKGASLAGAMSVQPGVWMYQMTDKGLAVEATVKGTKYWKDEDLNRR